MHDHIQIIYYPGQKIETAARTWHRHVICRACTRLCLACVPVSIFFGQGSTLTLSSRKTALREQHWEKGRDRETGAAAGAAGGNWSPGSCVTTVGPTTFEGCFRWRWGHQVGSRATVVHERFVLSHTESDSKLRVWLLSRTEAALLGFPPIHLSNGAWVQVRVLQFLNRTEDWGL